MYNFSALARSISQHQNIANTAAEVLKKRFQCTLARQIPLGKAPRANDNPKSLRAPKDYFAFKPQSRHDRLLFERFLHGREPADKAFNAQNRNAEMPVVVVILIPDVHRGTSTIV
jgi:hypothetical protein